PEDAPASAVGEAQAPQDRDRGPDGVEEVQDDRGLGGGGEKPRREKPEREREGEGKENRVRKRPVGLQDLHEARDVQELAGRRHEEDRSDREPQGQADGARPHWEFNCQSYGMNSTFHPSGILSWRYLLTKAMSEGDFFRKSSV